MNYQFRVPKPGYAFEPAMGGSPGADHSADQWYAPAGNWFVPSGTTASRADHAGHTPKAATGYTLAVRD